MITRVDIPPDEKTPEPEVEDDDAELILEKVEEEMMAEGDDEDEDLLHVDDITKLYGDGTVIIFFYIKNGKKVRIIFFYFGTTISF